MSPSPSVIEVTVRPCEEKDIPSLTGIYAHHVLHGLASFEVEPPSESDMRQRRRDEYAGEIVGYAYASPYRLRPAYRYTAENSVYLHPEWTGKGVGGELLSAPALRMRSKRTAADRGRHWR
jgi:L-amino acid N-acyltransferase YncA